MSTQDNSPLAPPDAIGTPVSPPSPGVPAASPPYTNQEAVIEESPDKLFTSLSVSEDGELAASPELDYSVILLNRLTKLLPVPDMDLTQQELLKVQMHQEANIVLGAAGSSTMICEAEKCPFELRCPLMQMQKAPKGENCPFEASYVIARFVGWMKEFGKTEGTLLESERATIASLVTLDLDEQRCRNKLGEAENADLTQKNVKEVDADGKAMAWDTVISAYKEEINNTITQRRMLLKDSGMTRDAKIKLARLEGKSQRADLSVRQSSANDLLQMAMRGEIIDAELVPAEEVEKDSEKEEEKEKEFPTRGSSTAAMPNTE